MIIALDARPLVRRQIAGAEQRARNILAAWAQASRDVQSAAAHGGAAEKGSANAGAAMSPPGAGAGAHEFFLLFPRPGDADAARENFDDSLVRNLPPNFHPLEISSFQFPSSYHYGSRMLNVLARTIARIRADVYHSFTPDVPRIAACPVVPTVHDLSFELDPVVRRTAAGKQEHRIAAQSAQYASRLIAVSSQTKYDVASIYQLPPDRIDVIYNGIDGAFSPTPATEIPRLQPIHRAHDIRRPYVLAVGADIPRRNYARMLSAMEAVWKSPDAVAGNGDSGGGVDGGGGSVSGKRALQPQWVLAGREDWNGSQIFSAGRDAGVLHRMRFVRSPSNLELADLYRGAALTCCASSFEGFGLSVLESMACGTSVACSDMRSLREVAEDAAVYFPHDDADLMGQAIGGLLEDAEYRRQLRYRGIFRASLFTWQTAAQLTLASLRAAVS